MKVVDSPTIQAGFLRVDRKRCYPLFLGVLLQVVGFLTNVRPAVILLRSVGTVPVQILGIRCVAIVVIVEHEVEPQRTRIGRTDPAVS